MKKIGILALLACLPVCLLADFSYEQSTKVTGGMMAGMMKMAGAFSRQAREPMQSTVAVKGNRMVHQSKDHTQLIDLDNETITTINFQKKTYSVMTFAEMTEAMNQAMQRMNSNKKDGKTEMEFKMSAKDTGETRQINGLQAKQKIMTMEMEGTDEKTGNKGGMRIVNDMWVAEKIPGFAEVGEFHKRMAGKMAWSPDGGNMMAGRPDIARGMAGVYKEVSKLDGMPILQVMKMTPMADGQPASGDAGSTPSKSRSRSAESPSIGGALGGALGGKLGGFGGFGKKKKPEPAKEEPVKDESEQAGAAPEGGSDSSGALIEMTTELSSFSSAPVDPSKFSVPSGFKKVDSEMTRGKK